MLSVCGGKEGTVACCYCFVSCIIGIGREIMGCYLFFKASSVLPTVWEHNALYPSWRIELLLNLSTSWIGFLVPVIYRGCLQRCLLRVECKWRGVRTGICLSVVS